MTHACAPNAPAADPTSDDLLRALAAIDDLPRNDKYPDPRDLELERMLQEMRASEGGGAPGCPVGLPTPPPTPSIARPERFKYRDEALPKGNLLTRKYGPTTTATIAGATVTTTPAKPKRAANLNRRPWSRLPEPARLYSAATYCEEVGGMAVSLNLHPDTAARWTAGTLKTRTTDLFRDGLNRALKAAGIAGLPYLLQFEIAPGGRLHVHGVIDTHDRDPTEIDAIKLALRTAAGRIDGKAAGRQLMLKAVTDGPGWATYLGKVRELTLAQMNLDAITITSRPMTKRAGIFHENARRKRHAA
ncbi:hypothetical protein [Paracoccus marcusii]|uniref:hypothetical protein n=1 Tax=Paracoccus marcusii TaxID=59779 RepID=UPI003262D0DC